MKNSNVYCNAIDLALYICEKYKSKHKHEISGIKLQKSLYFLFAYWGAFVRKSNSDNSVEEKIELPEYLFNDEIEAWTYGPVVSNVYRNIEIIKNFSDESEIVEIKQKLSQNNSIFGFINDLLKDIFEISDFKLVDMSHQDKCWKDNYIESDERHNRIINKESIINEYFSKI